eukprot:TRINITY_DN7200_c0_g1_i1.p1 TRINITY_DN7200_c0_g1~~TRINITY_DN7200_c0_g1_i1.p1  ORF type:complete len:498 (+),score=78.24 TRINITY_DN7200_c0_g1_i1:204-1496(+)
MPAISEFAAAASDSVSGVASDVTGRFVDSGGLDRGGAHHAATGIATSFASVNTLASPGFADAELAGSSLRMPVHVNPDYLSAITRPTEEGLRKANAALGCLLELGRASDWTAQRRIAALWPAEIRQSVSAYLADRELFFPAGHLPLPALIEIAASTGLPVALCSNVECPLPLEVYANPCRVVLRGKRLANGNMPTIFRDARTPLVAVRGGEVVLEDLALEQRFSREGVDAEALLVADPNATVTCRNVDFVSKSDCGVCVCAGHLRLTNCAISDCGGTGLVLFGGSAELERTHVDGNRRFGVYARDARVDFLGGNHVVGNGHSGVIMAANANGTWQGKNTLRQNGPPPVRLGDGCRLDGWNVCGGGGGSGYRHGYGGSGGGQAFVGFGDASSSGRGGLRGRHSGQGRYGRYSNAGFHYSGHARYSGACVGY